MTIILNDFSDIRTNIYSYVEGKDLLSLRLSNAKFYNELSDEVFKEKFFQANPFFQDIRANLFTNISPRFPGFFWKAAYCQLNQNDESTFSKFMIKLYMFKYDKIHTLLTRSEPLNRQSLTKQFYDGNLALRRDIEEATNHAKTKLKREQKEKSLAALPQKKV